MNRFVIIYLFYKLFYSAYYVLGIVGVVTHVSLLTAL